MKVHKFIAEPHGPYGGANLHFFTPSQTPVYITKPQIHSVPFSVAVAGSHCAYLYRDGQAELTSMAGYLR